MHSCHPASLPVLRLRISNRPAARQIETSFTHHKMVWVWNKQEAGAPWNSQSPAKTDLPHFSSSLSKFTTLRILCPCRAFRPPARRRHLTPPHVWHLRALKMIPSAPYKLTSSVQPGRSNTKPKYRTSPPPPLLQLVPCEWLRCSLGG